MANYVFNSSSSGDTYNAKCLNVSDDSEWTPSAAEYPQDGTIDLSGGTSGRYLDTQWIAPQGSEWTMSGIYNVVMGVSYDMYSIHYKGNHTCDIYLGSNTEDLTLSESDKDYTPPTGTWIIEEEPPAIIIPEPSESKFMYFSMGDVGTGADEPPVGVTVSNTISASPLVSIPLPYSDGTVSGITLSSNAGMSHFTADPTMPPVKDTGFLLNCQYSDGMFKSTEGDVTFTFNGLDSAKTYTIKCASNNLWDDRECTYTIAGGTPQIINSGGNYTTGDTGVVTGVTSTTFLISRTPGLYMHLSGITIEEA